MNRLTLVGSGKFHRVVIVAYIYVYIFVLTASAINLQVRGERETSAGQRHCQASGKSPESARDRQIHSEQNADGVDEQPQGKACQ